MGAAVRSLGRALSVVVGIWRRGDESSLLKTAVGEARLRGARLHIVRVVGGGLSENPSQRAQWAQEVADARVRGDRLVANLASEGIEATHRVEAGSMGAADVLIRTVTEVDAELLVVGIRKRSPVGKVFLGSVSQQTILGADCPVLAIHVSDERSL